MDMHGEAVMSRMTHSQAPDRVLGMVQVRRTAAVHHRVVHTVAGAGTLHDCRIGYD